MQLETKILEVRDEGTCFGILCVNMNPTWGNKADELDESESVLHLMQQRCGYPCDGRPNIGVTRLNANGSPFTNDYFWWPRLSRTMHVAHQYVVENWPDLRSGDVIDIQFIIGETKTPKKPERIEALERSKGEPTC